MESQSIVSPIAVSTTFSGGKYVYSRITQPTVEIVEQELNKIEGGMRAFIFRRQF